MNFECQIAREENLDVVSSILTEAAQWQRESGAPRWKEEDLTPTRLRQKVRSGIYHIGFRCKDPAGVFSLESIDELFWPGFKDGDALFLHKLAVRRKFAKTGVSYDLLKCAQKIALGCGKKYLRLDCDASRPRLTAFYRDFGFTQVKSIDLGGYIAARFQIELAVGSSL
ncbi:MAG: GNAT family N-acetyltransferase [Opitutales bacterium]|nr:GNAT family N-acetyltransferase [Opitutales bacterium]